mgnify:CR=1 FL=1
MLTTDGYHPVSFDPRQPDLVLELHELDDIGIAVVDSLTGRPIQRAVIEIVSVEEGPAPGEKHFHYTGFNHERFNPLGRFFIPADSLEHQRRVMYRIKAPGYEASEQLVLKEAGLAPGSTTLHVAMEPETP